MSLSKVKERGSNIELFRIVATLMILVGIVMVGFCMSGAE